MRFTVFELLAEPIRLRIVEILATGEHTAGELAEAITGEFGVGRTAVSNHLRTLLDSDFVVVRCEGQSRVYRLNDSAMDRLDLAVDRLHDFWDARFGWPYQNDPPTTPTRSAAERRRQRRQGRGRGMRGRREGWVTDPVSVFVDAEPVDPSPAIEVLSSDFPAHNDRSPEYRIDPWQFIPD